MLQDEEVLLKLDGEAYVPDSTQTVEPIADVDYVPEDELEDTDHVTFNDSHNYQWAPPSVYDQEVEKQRVIIEAALQEQAQEDQAPLDVDSAEYLQAIQTLQRYSHVVEPQASTPARQMGHAVKAKVSKEFLLLTASDFGGYLEGIADTLKKNKATKPVTLFHCPAKQYRFPDGSSWQLAHAEDQSDVELLMDEVTHVSGFYIMRKRFHAMESQMWEATGASSHLDHFLHGIDEALGAVLSKLEPLQGHDQFQELLKPIRDCVLDAQLMRRVAGGNNIHLMQTLMTSGANYQLIRRDADLYYHHRRLLESDIVQLRSLPFGQQQLYGPTLAAKAKKLGGLKQSSANDALMVVSTKLLADKASGGKARTHQQSKQDYRKKQPRGGGRGGTHSGTYTNAYGRQVNPKQKGSFRGQQRRGGGRGGQNKRGKFTTPAQPAVQPTTSAA